MAIRKKTTTRKTETRGRKKTPLEKQIWFRVTQEEKEMLEAEAFEQGRSFSGHVRWEFLEGRKARGKPLIE